jgi:HD-GYP domain-containing protein (c-di-GMP phosphodiesterase class II)
VPPELLRAHLEDDKFARSLVSDGIGDAICSLADTVDDLTASLAGEKVLTGLNSIKAHDQYTFMHSLDVAIMGLVLGQRAGWDGVKLRSFGLGCLLHDLGKILIEPELLNKRGPLTPDEFERLKAHPQMGYEVIRATAPRLGTLVPAVAHQHHERQDGSGYPRQLRGSDRLGLNEPGRIHDFGAVCAVADTYDAMVSHRPYRRARPTDEVLATIVGYAGTHLNADVVRLLRQAVSPWPVLSAVRVKNGGRAGYEGIVTALQKNDLTKPRVRLLYDAARQRIAPIEVDLAVDRDVEIESVRDPGSQCDSLGSPKLKPPVTHAYAVPRAVLAALKRAV